MNTRPSIDDLLMQQDSVSTSALNPIASTDVAEPVTETHTDSPETYDDVPRETLSNDTPEPEHAVEDSSEPAADLDDYGVEVPKQEKVYTQSEVNEMIRKRLARGKSQTDEYQQAPQQQYQEPAPQQYQEQSPSGEPWRDELSSMIAAEVRQIESVKQRQAFEQQAQAEQRQFEEKFNRGMSKYADFDDVVTGKPITSQMVMATRGMDDPAAFIYAAAKLQPKELDRIARLGDPMAQAVEIGRLDAMMRKSRSSVSTAPRPIGTVRGDVVEKSAKAPKTVDDILRNEDARRMQSKRR